MKTLKFRDFKAKMILDETKTSSLRLFDDKNLTKGDELELINSDTGKAFAHIQITEIIKNPFSDIHADDLVGHEPFKDYDDMYQTLKNYYPNIRHDTPAKIIRFKLISKYENRK
ncbi:MAG: ASCH domain-containing protein [Patescibacteria group bacterium]